MMNVETYRETAAAMRKRAESAGTPEHRAAWAVMAVKWDKLAEEVAFAARSADVESDAKSDTESDTDSGPGEES